MHSTGGNLHFTQKIAFCCEKSGNKVLRAVTFMASTAIIFQFWQHFDAAVRMFWNTACVECHVMHKIGLHLASMRKLDFKIVLFKRSTQYQIKKHGLLFSLQHCLIAALLMFAFVT